MREAAERAHAAEARRTPGAAVGSSAGGGRPPRRPVRYATTS